MEDRICMLFYPFLRCFTFSDFQLDPTLEEFKRILGRELRDHDPFPKLNEDITQNRITLALSIDVHDMLANWDVEGGFQRVYQKILRIFSPKVREERKLESILRGPNSLSPQNCTIHEHR